MRPDLFNKSQSKPYPASLGRLSHTLNTRMVNPYDTAKTQKPSHNKMKIVRKTDPSLWLNLFDWTKDVILFPFKAIGFLISAPLLLIGLAIHKIPRILEKPRRESAISDTPYNLAQIPGPKATRNLDLKSHYARNNLGYRPLRMESVFPNVTSKYSDISPRSFSKEVTLDLKKPVPSQISNQEQKQNVKKNGPGRLSFPRIYWGRSLASALILATSIVIVAGLFTIQSSLRTYNSVFAEAMDGQAYLEMAQQALVEQNFLTAQNAFLSAQDSFEIALENLEKNKTASSLPVIGNKITTGEYVLQTGRLIAKAGSELTTGLEPITDILKGQDSTQITEATSMADYTSKIMTVMTIARPQLRSALDDLNEATALLEQIDEGALSQEQLNQTLNTQEELSKLTELLDQTYQLSTILPDLLGNNGARHYLLIFQNTAEQRPTGGFIGSYGIVSFNQGKLSNFYTDNVYNPDGQLTVQGYCEQPPRPLQNITECWGMRDANWSPDFPTSAQKIRQLYEKGSGNHIDGIIAINPKIIQNILELTGPIYMNNWNTIVTSDNAIDLIQYKVDVEFKDEKDPKLFLIDLSQLVFDRIFALNPSQWPSLFTMLNTSLEQKDIMISPFDPDAANFMRNNNWDGHMLENEQDYLMVVSSNIGGTKTNTFVNKRLKLDTEIYSDGIVQNTLTISYEHKGNWDWPSSVLYEYQRIYLPLGSQLVASTNPQGDGGKESVTDVYEDQGKTVFADYIRVYPGGTVNISYTYQLPFTVLPGMNMNYSLLAQKQPGTELPLEKTIIFDAYRLEPLQSSSTLAIVDHRTIAGAVVLETDDLYQLKFIEHSVL